jgi:hypothetical protein
LKNQKISTPKSKEPARKVIGWDSKDKSSCSNSKKKQNEDRPNYQKLYEAANNVIRIF